MSILRITAKNKLIYRYCLLVFYLGNEYIIGMELDKGWMTASQIEKEFGVTHVQRMMSKCEQREYVFCGRKCHAYKRSDVIARIQQRNKYFSSARKRYEKRPNIKKGTHSRLKKVLDKTLYLKLRNAWYGMMRRCYTEDRPDYQHYRDQKISVCNEWLNSFDEFALWALDNGVKAELSLDRIDNNKGYSPDNCRWATKTIQNNNSSQNITVTFRGEEKTIGEWAAELGIKYHTLYNRIMVKGWSAEKAFTTPIKKHLLIANPS